MRKDRFYALFGVPSLLGLRSLKANSAPLLDHQLSSEMTTTLSEDDIYRTSTQYRLWSFSPESLAALRRKTHDIALERARGYTGQQHQANGVTNGDGAVQQNGVADSEGIEYLTEEEELRLVQRYCDQIRSTSDHFKWPVNVKATAVQYLKRFYLSNSCMTYPPKEIYKTVLFLACKTEATHMTLSEYARRISTDPELVLAPEYKVMQALRFTLDVKQPYRGLKGVFMEMLNLAEGRAGAVPEHDGPSGKELQDQMLSLPPSAPNESRTQWKPPGSGDIEVKHLNDRINAAYTVARTLLDAPALLTDVFFLHTPSQILLASMHLADPILTSFYLSKKLPSVEPNSQIISTIHGCAEMLASFSQDQVLTKDGRAQLEEKLEKCRDPSTKDLVKAFAAVKQGGGEGGKADEAAVKRRKMEKEKHAKEGDDLFGPGLSKHGNANGTEDG